MSALLTDNLPLLAGAPNGIQKLRELILELAVRGKLVPQDPSDEPASELSERIRAAKQSLLVEFKVRKQKELTADLLLTPPYEIPAGWEWQSIDDVLLVTGGVTLGRKLAGREVVAKPYLRVANVQRGHLDLNEIKGIEVPEDEVEKYLLRNGDLLITEGGDWDKVGRTAIWRDELPECLHQNHVFRARAVTTEWESRWAELYLNSAPAREYFAGSSKQTTNLASINMTQLRACAFPLPPLAEQHRIVAKVDELMALCDRLEARQADTESAHARLVQALLDSLTQASDADDFAASWQRLSAHFHSLFTSESSIDALKQTLLQLAVMGKLLPQEPSDEPITNFLQHYAIKSNPHFLEGWAEVSLGSLGEILGGSTPSKANAEFWDGDIPWISPKDMKRPVIHDAQDHVSAKALAQTSLKAVPPQSLLMVVRGMILAHSFPVALTAREVTINQDMKALVPPKEISTYLLMYLQAAKDVIVGLVDRSSHGTCKLISKKLWLHTVCLPPLPEQHRIVAKLDQLMTLCDQLKTRLTTARQLHERLAGALVEQAVA